MRDEYERAMNQAMVYLGTRARTAKQMEEYLQKKEHDERTIAQVMEKLTEYRLIDDEEYARRYVETRKGSAGKYLLRQKMRTLGLDADTIDEAVSSVPFDEQVAAARTLLERKLEHDVRPDAMRRAVQAVMRRGFAYDAVRAAANAYEEELQWDE